MEIVYLDNAASSWPKPPSVSKAMADTVDRFGANPGRGTHRMAVEAGKILFSTRRKLAQLFQIRNPNDIAFALNTTYALNMAILGYLKQGDHVVCTAVEHNAVRRPLERLKEAVDVTVTYVETLEDGSLNPADVKRSMMPNTKLVVINHSSNVLGSILPIEEIAEIAHVHGAKILVDAAQSAGILPIDVEKMGIDMLAFPGHKGLYGPQGTGGLYLHPDIELDPVITGGTGSQSESIQQPNVRPDRYESGTQNVPGIAGLGEGVDAVLHEKVQNIHNREWGYTQRMMEGLLRLSGLKVLGPALGQPRTGIVSFTADWIDSSELAYILDQHFGIAVRAGFHCSPLAHRTAKTEKTGAVRASVGMFTTDDEVDRFLEAMKQIHAAY